MKHGAIDSFHQIFVAIEEELGKRRHLPALILIYTTIDSIAWLVAASHATGVRNRFEQWVNRWMLPKLTACSAAELYAARCGILHTFTSRSDLSNSGKARRIAYSLGAASASALQKTLDQSTPGEYVVIGVQDLYCAMRDGLRDSLSHVLDDEAFADEVTQRLHTYFCTLEGAEADAFVRD